MSLQDSEADVHGLSPLAIEVLSWLALIAGSPCLKAQRVLKAALPNLLDVSVMLCQLTEHDLADWEDDIDQYVADEEDEGLDASVRAAAGDLVGELVEVFGQDLLLRTLTDVCARRLLHDKGWKMVESVVL